MHVLFLHSNFPAQFGQIASHLARYDGYRCTFLNEQRSGRHSDIDCVKFVTSGGATSANHFCAATFENQIRRSAAAYDAMQRHIRDPASAWTDIDLIVAHSGFVSPLFLAELFPKTPVVGYFEYFYHRFDSDFDFRVDLPRESSMSAMRLRARNAMLLLDLNHCTAGYCPTEFQRSRFPPEYQSKLTTIFDGVDMDFWQRDSSVDRSCVGGVDIPTGHHVITYVSRGFESMRGGDLFLRVADQICRRREDVTFIVVGEDRVAYGGDSRFTDGKSFRDWAIETHQIDTSRIHFVDRLSASELTQVFSASDLHLYWTVPFVLSWSLVNAMACGCAIIASDTEPVREMIRDGENGWLVNFFDVEGWIVAIDELLNDPARRQTAGQMARKFVNPPLSLTNCLAQMKQLYSAVIGG